MRMTLANKTKKPLADQEKSLAVEVDLIHLSSDPVDLKLAYLVHQASWTPSYDVRVSTASEGSFEVSYYGYFPLSFLFHSIPFQSIPFIHSTIHSFILQFIRFVRDDRSKTEEGMESGSSPKRQKRTGQTSASPFPPPFLISEASLPLSIPPFSRSNHAFLRAKALQEAGEGRWRRRK